MPFVEDDRVNSSLDRAINYPKILDPNASFDDKVTSAFRLENTIISHFAKEKKLPDGYADTDYDVWGNLTEDEKLNSQFVSLVSLADNDDELNAVRNQYKREQEDRAKLTGMDGFAAAMLAGVVDLPSLIPGAAASKIATAGDVLKGGLAVGAFAAGSATASELALQQSQLTRTGQETAANITGSMILGGLLGAGVAKLSQAKTAKYADDIEKAFKEPEVTTVTNDSAGAMAVFGDVQVKGKYVKQALKALSPIDPLARVMTASSGLARKFGALMFENPLVVEGVTGRSVEQITKTKQGMLMGQAVNDHIKIFQQAKKEGYKGKRNEFNVLVAREQANPGSTGNAHANRSAEVWNSKLYQKVQKELQDADLLGEDLDVKTAMRYLNRRWNKEAVAGKLPEFKKVVSNWLRKEQPEIEDPEELAGQIAMRIMGTPDGVIKYDESFGFARRKAKAEKAMEDLDVDSLKGVELDERVRIKETDEIVKVKADASDVHTRLEKQKSVLLKLKECLDA